MKALILKGVGGLGNRLLTTGWALSFAARNHRIICVDWRDGQYADRGDNAFEEFFEISGEYLSTTQMDELVRGSESVSPFIWHAYPDAPLYELYEHKTLSTVWVKARIHHLPFRAAKMIPGFWELKDKYLSKSGLRRIRALSMLDGNHMPMARYLLDGESDSEYLFAADFLPEQIDLEGLRRIQLSIQEKQRVLNLEHQFGVDLNNCIGIHVRMTDRSPGRDISFLYNILGYALSYSKRTIFLSTDSLDAEIEFQKRYPNVRFLKKLLPKLENEGLHQWAYHSTKAGLAKQTCREAISDLYFLSRCGALLFQGNSTFSTIARVWASMEQRQIDWTSASTEDIRNCFQ